ncbi:MAG: hypothetical protein ACREU7_01410 [Burkholderiales bacterium]
MNPILIGLDDTDNETSRGTGYRARCLARELERAGLGIVAGVTRHQLLVDDAIPYTSHNSSACLSLTPRQRDGLPAIIQCCRSFLLGSAADGSDVGLCAASAARAANVQEFGRSAQREVLQRAQAEELARVEEIFLEGLTGDHQGKIGALAAVGLYSSGDDGRYIWVKGIRELEDETVSLRDLRRMTGVEVIRTFDGVLVNDGAAMIQLGPWPRPIRESGKATLLVEKNHGGDARWKVVDKEAIKACRP